MRTRFLFFPNQETRFIIHPNCNRTNLRITKINLRYRDCYRRDINFGKKT